MIENIKLIVSKYTKIPVGQISNETVIDKTAFSGSILIHRMYAEIEKIGVSISDYHKIVSFGQLYQRITGEVKELGSNHPKQLLVNRIKTNANSQLMGIGIDIEKVSNLPDSLDFRADDFYKSVFTPKEIAHCVLQPNPKLSFTGLFCLKEAIIKSNQALNINLLNEIEICHNPAGAPEMEGYLLSISHVDDLAVGMALRL